ncbi:MAG: calcium-binding protein, partial [Rubripirellula sp.]|nr:calcium-binding protein [Rubripirellula sp.]
SAAIANATNSPFSQEDLFITHAESVAQHAYRLEFKGKYAGTAVGQLLVSSTQLTGLGPVGPISRTQVNGNTDDRLVGLLSNGSPRTDESGEELYNVRSVHHDSGAILHDSFVYTDQRFIVNYGTSIVTSGTANGSGFETIEVSGRRGDDVIISDDTAAFITINGDQGKDSFYVGTVYSTETVFVDGRLVDVVSEVANGTSVGLEINGGSQGDYFEVNRTAEAISLYGDSGDDVFFVKALLTLDESGGIQDFQSAVVNISSARAAGAGGDARTVDADTLIYVENANIEIDGGSGFDSLGIVGTALSDTLYVYRDTDDNGFETQRIFGAGNRLANVTNVEKTVLILGGGDDEVYLYGFDGGAISELGINLGSGSDSVFIGGDRLVFEDRRFRESETSFFNARGYSVVDDEILGRTAKRTKNLDELLAYTVSTPPIAINTTVEKKRQIDQLKTPVLIDGGLGIRNRVVIDNSDGPSNVEFTDFELIKRSFTTNSTYLSVLGRSSTVSETDLISEILEGNNSADGDAKDDITSFVANYVAFQDRYEQRTLVTEIVGLTAGESKQITLPAGLSYKAFKEKRNSAGDIATARSFLDAYLKLYGYEAEYTTTTFAATGQKMSVLDRIASIANPSSTLAFTAQYDEIKEVDGTGATVKLHRNLQSVALKTASPLSLQLAAGYIPRVDEVDSSVYQQVKTEADISTLYFKNMDEFELKLSDHPGGTVVIDTDYTGITTIEAGVAGSVFDINRTSSTKPTYLVGSNSADSYVIDVGSTDSIVRNELFIDGRGGEDEVRIDNRLKGAPTVKFVAESWQRSVNVVEKLNLTDAMEVNAGVITPAEQAILFNRIAAVAVTYAANASTPPLLNEGSKTSFTPHVLEQSDYIAVLNELATQLGSNLLEMLVPVEAAIEVDTVATLITDEIADDSAELSAVLSRLKREQQNVSDADKALRDLKDEKIRVQLFQDDVSETLAKLKTLQTNRESAIAKRDATFVMAEILGANSDKLDKFIVGTATEADVVNAFAAQLRSEFESDLSTYYTAVATSFALMKDAAVSLGKDHAQLQTALDTLK